MGSALPFIAAGAALIGGAASVVGGISGANAEKEAAKKQQEAAEAQAAVTDMSVIDALTRGAADVGRIRQNASRVISQQRTAYAGAGVDVGQGTATDVLASTRAQSELDVLTAKNNAARQAWGFKEEAYNLRRHGQYARASGESRATGTLLTGVAGGIQGLGSAVATYSQYGTIPKLKGS